MVGKMTNILWCDLKGDPKRWHYSLMAERWAEFLNETPELEFFDRAAAKYDEPVLDLACGAGRLLVPLLRSGIDVDGYDFCQDMLDQCKRIAFRERL
jgi:SAM-dependent methyltransferase